LWLHLFFFLFPCWARKAIESRPGPRHAPGATIPGIDLGPFFHCDFGSSLDAAHNVDCVIFFFFFSPSLEQPARRGLRLTGTPGHA
jgi:hypothetical protein